jgi:hypothetical protein
LFLSDYMKPTDDLFKLIRSLNANEKRHFKLYAQHQAAGKYKTRYEKLFDAFNNWGEADYDESAFKKKHKGKAFLKNFAVQKKELYELLLKVMRNISVKNDYGDVSSLQQFSEINFLISKGLHVQALKIVEEGKKIAEYREDWITAMKFHQYHNSIGPFDIDNTSKVYTGIYLKETMYLQKQAYLINVRMLRRRMFSWQTSADLEKNSAEAKEVLAGLEKYYNDPLTPALAKVFCLWGLYQYYFNTGQALKCVDLLTGHLEEKEAGIFDGIYSQSIYGVTLANLLNAAAVVQDWELYAKTIDRYRTLKAANINQASEFAWVLCDAEIHLAMNHADYGEAKIVIGNAEACLEKYKQYLSVIEVVFMNLNMALLEMLCQHFKEAYQHLSAAHDLLEKEERRHYIKGLVKTLMFISKAGSAEFDELENDLRSLKRFFKQYDLSRTFYGHLWSFFAAVIKQGDIKSKKIKPLIAAIMLHECPAEYEEVKKVIKKWQ